MASERSHYVLDLVSVALLSLATVTASWCAYQATRWSGEQAAHYNLANGRGIESTRLEGLANNQALADLVVFTSLLAAVGAKNTTLQEFYRARARPEFKPALEAWIASRPLHNPRAAPSPFALPEYRLALREQSKQLHEESHQLVEKGQIANRNGDNYVLASVLLSAVLFFTGVSQQLRRTRMRMAMLTLGVLLLLAGVIGLLRLPVA